MRNTVWVKKNENAENLNIKNNPNKIDMDVLKILSARNLEIDSKLEDIDPFSLKDVDISVEEIKNAKKNNETIWIYGDYDVDGITSVSLCYLALTEIGIDVKFYIPLRDEGYGLNKDALKHIKDEGGKLVITVDCGISSIEEVDYANSIGLKVIITDHHEMKADLPKSFAAINPKRAENIYSFTSLAGVGTAFMLIYALYKDLGVEENIYKFLDIVAIGTVADIVPLVHDNRLFVKEGLKQLNNSNWIGIKSLLKKVFVEYKEKEFNSYDIGFIIAPIFNAAGRLEDAKNAVSLFIEKDAFKCLPILDKLIENNIKRKEIQANILNKSIQKIEKEKLYEKNILLLADSEFHHGVIGIVASKLVEKYYRPVIIMEIKKDEGIATASCRSTDTINILELIGKASDLLIKYGGHFGAAGFSIKIENIEPFFKKIEEEIDKIVTKDSFYKKIYIEKELPIYKISYNFLTDMKFLEPFGAGNATPIFYITNCSFDNVRIIGKDKSHMMMNVIKDNITLRNCAWFGGADIIDKLLNLKKVDIAFKLKLETYKDMYQYKIYIEDIKESKGESTLNDFFEISETVFPIKTVFYTKRDDIEDNLKLQFNADKVNIMYGKSVVGSLDSGTTYVLRKLKDFYNYNFNIKIKEKISKIENCNVVIEIFKDTTFSSYAIKEPQLFNDIKQFLIGNLNYNSVERAVLASIFKDKKRTLAILEEGRGITTIINSISLYYNFYNKKVLLIGNNLKEEDTLYSDYNSEYKDGYDFYIILHPSSYEGISKIENENILVLSKESIDLENFNLIEDSYTISKNIEIVEKEELFGKKIVYTNNLPYKKREEIISNLNSFKKIYSTKEIKVIF